MRVSDGMTFAAMRSSVQSAQARALAATNEASSGKRVNKSSEDPNAYGQAMVYDRTLAKLDSMDRTSNVAATDLTAASDALTTSSNILTRVKEIAVAGANATLTAADRATYAQEIRSLRDSLVESANTRSGDTYVFSGAQSATAAYSATGVYQGDNGVRSIDVGNGASVDANVPGTNIFTPTTGVDIFALLERIEGFLGANDQAGVQGTLNDIDTGKSQISQGQTSLGLKLQRVEDATATRDTVRVEMKSAKASAVDADPSSSYINLLQAQQSLEAAATATQKMISVMGRGIYR